MRDVVISASDISVTPPAETQDDIIVPVIAIVPNTIAEVAEAVEVEVTAPEATLSALSAPADERCPEYESTFAEYGLEPVAAFSYIAWHESRCTVSAINSTLNRDKSRDIGLLQINSTWKTVTSKICGTPWGDMDALLNVECNLRVAKYLLKNGGLSHWSSWNKRGN